MGDQENVAKKDRQLSDKKAKSLNVTNFPVHPDPNTDEGLKVEIANYSSKGIFGPNGFLAALDSSSEQPCSSFASSSMIIMKEPSLTNNDDEKQYQVCPAPKKFKSSSESDAPNPTCLQKVKSVDENAIRTRNEHNALLNPNSPFSLEENVFSIDHVLEFIVSELDRETLLNCRLVSLRWAYFTSKALQKVVNIQIDHQQSFNNRRESKRPYYHFYLSEDLCLSTLISVMNNSVEFPSKTFSFLNRNDVGQLRPSAEPFFKAQGTFITKLRLDGWVDLKNVKTILFTHAPNIQQLILSDLISECQLGLRATTGHNHLDYDPSEDQPKQTNFQSAAGTSIVSPKQFLKNLRVYKCDVHIPHMFIKHILEWSPNLVAVILPEEGLRHLVAPINRLHLLKKLKTYIDNNTLRALEPVANHHEGNLRLERIEFRRWDPQDYYPDSKEVIDKILEGAAGTCQRLVWDYFPTIQMPKMPQVKYLSFECHQEDDLPLNVFERWIHLGDTFPNLQSLSIMIGQNFLERPFDNFFGDTVNVRILSVKDVHFSYEPQEIVIRGFNEMFPNATIHTRSEGTERIFENAEDFV